MAIKSRLVGEMLDEEYNFELPVSMIDVVFLLLIFFLVASRFKQPEDKLDTKFSKKWGPNPVQTKVIPPREYRIKVDGTGAGPDFMLDNRPIKDRSDLVYKLRTAAASSPQLSVVIVGKHKTPFVYVVWALDACNLAEIDDVKFQGLPVEGFGRPVDNG